MDNKILGATVDALMLDAGCWMLDARCSMLDARVDGSRC